MVDIFITLKPEVRKNLRRLAVRKHVRLATAACIAFQAGLTVGEERLNAWEEWWRSSPLQDESLRLAREADRAWREAMALDSAYAVNHFRAGETFGDVNRQLMRYYGLQAEARYVRSQKDLSGPPPSLDLIPPSELERMSDRYLFRKKSANQGEDPVSAPQTEVSGAMAH